MNNKMIRILLAIGLVLMLSVTAWCQVSYHPVNLATYANFDLNYDGTAYPDGRTNLGGIPFDIPTVGYSEWCAQYATGANPRILDIDVGLSSAVEVQTLINTAWGQPGPSCYCWLEFFGSEGAYYRKDLIGDVDLRDIRENTWTNTINGTTTVNVWQGVSPSIGAMHRTDKQSILLPAAFQSQRLVRVRLTDVGDEGFQRVLIYGLTVGTVPEPSSVLALLCGIAGLGGMSRLRYRKQTRNT